MFSATLKRSHGFDLRVYQVVCILGHPLVGNGETFPKLLLIPHLLLDIAPDILHIVVLEHLLLHSFVLLFSLSLPTEVVQVLNISHFLTLSFCSF